MDNLYEAQEESTKELVDKIVELEWKTFDKVKNEGGRADCQDDFNTFNIMRRSQYMTWPKTLLESWIDDFEEAISQGINLITYKYGYMMETTAPDNFKNIKDSMPEISPEKRALIDQIVAIQVVWMEDFADIFPHLMGNARSIHTKEDSLFNTSAETYLRGELMTYSDRTLKMYGGFVAQLAKTGKNLTHMTMENTVHLYGYDSLTSAEKLMS